LNILPAYTEYFHLTTGVLALQSAIGWAGAMVVGFFFGQITEAIGRRRALYISVWGVIAASILQTASRNVAMFVISRFLVGMANGSAYICGPTYLAETLPMKWRGVGLGIFMDFYYIGRLKMGFICIGPIFTILFAQGAFLQPGLLTVHLK
jgi:MFS family permease